MNTIVWNLTGAYVLGSALCILVQFIIIFVLLAQRRRQQNREQKLRASEHMYRLLTENAGDMISRHAADDRLLYISPACRELFGYMPDEILHHGMDPFIHSDDLGNSWNTIYEAVAAGHKHYSTHHRIRHKQGHWVWAETRGRLIYDRHGDLAEIHCLTRDITDRKQAEETLRANEGKYRMLFDNMTQGTMFQRADGRIEEVNAALLEMLGVSYDEFVEYGSLHGPGWNVIHEDGSELSIDEWPATIALKTGEPVRNVTAGVFNPQQQAYVWGTISAIPQFKADENLPYRVFTTFHSVTELKRIEQELRTHQERLEELVEERTRDLQREIATRKQIEQSLRESEAQYRLIAENATDVIATQNSARQFTYLSPSIQQLLGYTPEEIIQAKHGPLLTPESEKIVANIIARKRPNDPEPKRLEVEQIRKDGSTVWVETIVKRLYDVAGHHTGFLGITRNISDRKQAEAALVQERELLYTLMDSSPDYLFFKDRESRFLRTNTAHAQELLGLAGPEEAVGKTDFDIFPQEEAQRFFDEEQRIMETGHPVVAREWTLHNTTGKVVWLSEHKVPIRDATGHVVGLVGISRDVTAQKQAEADLQQSKDAALQAQQRAEVAQRASEAANHAKSIFLSNMSHELRTPLNAILGFTQLLVRETLLSSEQQEYLGTINRSGAHLLQLINDVLDMSKIEAGRMSVNRSSFDLLYMLNTVEEMMRVRAEQKGLEFSVEHPDDLPHYIVTDEKKLRQILINLLGNSVKFTEHGNVTLKIETARPAISPDDGEHRQPGNRSASITIQFNVSDTGPGIVPEDLPFIFEAFHQTFDAKNNEGTGLGLAISRKFVQLLGGAIHVRSDPASGTQFIFTIQAEPANHYDVEALASTRIVRSLTPPQTPVRILVVDDHAESRQLLSLLLGNAGFEVNTAANGQEAVAQAQQWLPHSILMDMHMPVMDGYEATREIRRLQSENSTSYIPIIALTASAFEGEQQRILAVGCDAMLRKPINVEEVFETLRTHLNVEYLYDDEEFFLENSIPAGNGAVLTPDSLATFPHELIEGLKQAAINGDLELMIQFIAVIRVQHAELADSMMHLARNFKYQAIWDMIQQMPSTGGTTHNGQ